MSDPSPTGAGASVPPAEPSVPGGGSGDEEIVLTADRLVVEFRNGRQTVQAVSGVSFSVRNGETLGLVGESGCGKSTTGRALVQVQPPTSGTVTYKGQDLTTLSSRDLRTVRTKIQMIFQDPISSLNPRRRVKDIVAEPLNIWGRGTKQERAAKVREMLEAVGIDPDTAGDRRPQEFSGGQCQRISIARALMAEPDMLICDEPVSALDVSVQAQILNLLADLKERFGLTMVFIAHDLAVVKNVSDRVAVMYLGKLVEVAGSDELYRSAAHPYTEALLASIPEPDPDQAGNQKALTGELPSPLHPPSGCRFRTRCPYAQALCAEQEPPLRDIRPGHQVACHFPLGLTVATAGSDGSAESVGSATLVGAADDAEPGDAAQVATPDGSPESAAPPVITRPAGPPPAAAAPVTAPPVTPPPVAAPPVTTPPVTAPPVTAPPVTTPPVTSPPVPAAPGGSSAPPPDPASADGPAMVTEPGESDRPKKRKKGRKKKSE